MLSKRPAVIIGLLAAIAQAVLIWLSDNPSISLPEGLVVILTFLAGLVTNTQTFSKVEVRRAHSQPDGIRKLLAK